MGGQRVWKTVDRGDHWYPISEDLSTRDSAKIRMSMARTGGITLDATSAETHGTVVALAESPVRPGIIWAGTDDGNLWLSKNDGVSWENLTGRTAGVPRYTWVSRVEASSFDSATVYVTFDGHRNDDFHPYVYASNDFGKTFRSIKGNLPDTQFVHVVREDPRRKDLLFLGTEVTAWVSMDAGASWQPLNEGLPPAPVHDLRIHPRDRELVAATHGRSIFVMDIGPLERATDTLLNAPVAVFPVEPALLYSARGAGGGVGSIGNRPFGVPTPRPAALIPIRIKGEAARQIAGRPGADTAQFNPMAAMFGEQAAQFMQEAGLGGGGGRGGGLMALLMGGAGRPSADTVPVIITDVKGDTVRVFYTNARPTALRYISWDLRRDRAPLGPAAVRDSARAAVRIAQVRDSLRKAAGDTTAGARPTNLMAMLRDPQPGEPGQYLNPIQQVLGGGGGFGFRGAGGLLGGAGGFVEPGMYLVTIKLDGKEYKQQIEVVRPNESSTLSGGWR